MLFDYLYILYLKDTCSIYNTDPIKAPHPTEGSVIQSPRHSKPATPKYPHRQYKG